MKNTYLKIKNKKEFAKYVDLCLKEGYIWCDGSEDTVDEVWTNVSNLPSYVICSQRWRDCEMKVWYSVSLDNEEQQELSTLREYKFNTLKDKLK